MLTPASVRRRLAAGFTLIELLVVIAIIAILTSILLPAIFTVKERARQATSLSNLKAISEALDKYRLDHHKAPDVLFGYVYKDASNNVVSMEKAFAQALAAGKAADFFPGLYPQYISDYTVFQDPNNSADLSATQSLAVNALGPDGVLKPAPTNALFYTADAYDISPALDGNGAKLSTYIPRYQRAWASYPPPAALGADALRQLANPNPPGGTYITCTTYHVPKGAFSGGKVLVLFEGSNVETVDSSRLIVNGADPPSIAAPGTPNGASPAQFWRIKP